MPCSSNERVPHRLLTEDSAWGAGMTEVKALSVGGAWGYFTTDLVDQSVRAWLLFSSAGCFQKVIKRQGHDITNLLARLTYLLPMLIRSTTPRKFVR